MRVVKEELTKERYDQLSALKGKELEEELNIPIEWYCGYGYYGTSLVERDGKYYAIHNIGDSCD